MNRRLKAAIILRFSTQSDFADAVDEHESFVSKVVRRRRDLSPEKQYIWGRMLETNPRELFS